MLTRLKRWKKKYFRFRHKNVSLVFPFVLFNPSDISPFLFFFLLFFFCACATVEDTTRSRSQVLSLGVSVGAYLGAWRDLSCHRLTKSACKNYHRAAIVRQNAFADAFFFQSED